MMTMMKMKKRRNKMVEHKTNNLNLFFDASLIQYLDFSKFRISLDRFPAFLKDKYGSIIRVGTELLSLSEDEISFLMTNVKQSGEKYHLHIWTVSSEEGYTAGIKGTTIEIPTNALMVALYPQPKAKETV